MIWSQKEHFVTVLQPDADRYNGDPATDILDMGLYGHITFIIAEGVGGTGTVKIEVEECSDNAGTGNTAIAFKVRESTNAELGGTLTAVAAAGHTTTAGANKVIAVEVDAADLSDGKNWVRLQLTEVADSPVDAGVFAICSNARYQQETMPSPL